MPAHVFPFGPPRSKIEFAHKFSKNDNKNDKGSPRAALAAATANHKAFIEGYLRYSATSTQKPIT